MVGEVLVLLCSVDSFEASPLTTSLPLVSEVPLSGSQAMTLRGSPAFTLANPFASPVSTSYVRGCLVAVERESNKTSKKGDARATRHPTRHRGHTLYETRSEAMRTRDQECAREGGGERDKGERARERV